MKDNVRIYNKFEYYFEDCQCRYCSNYLGKVRGCKLARCCCEDVKIDAIAHGRMERKKGWDKWDG